MFFIVLLGTLILQCGEDMPAPTQGQAPPQAKVANDRGLFTEEAEALGIKFNYDNGFNGEYQMPEITAGGAGFLDFDNDGDMDLYLVQGGALTGNDDHLGDRLLRNDMQPGKPETLTFVDVTSEAGILATGYGQGVAVADYDSDGLVDIYVTNFGANQLWRNLGEGRFEEVSAAAGIIEDRWSVSASFFDFDRDDDLDLYVGNYCEYDLASNEKCFSPLPDYCNPILFDAAPDSFWRNNGDGTFENITASAGMDKAFGRALGVVAVDVNGDGWQDLYVANDLTANQLWLNQGNGSFTEKGMISGSAVVFNGLPGASMGVDAGDFDNDGDEDLFMTHLVGQLNTLYVNDGSGNFRDQTQVMGLGGPSLPHTGFGTAFFDFDRDGWLDLLTANGAVRKRDVLVAAGNPYPFQESNQLFRNRDGQSFEIVENAGAIFEEEAISRGAAFGDVDNDGDIDVAIVNSNGPLRFLRNQVSNENRWIGFRLLGSNSKRDMLGARLIVDRGKEPSLWRKVRADGSYASANDPRVFTGLGQGVNTVKVSVYWPNGLRETWMGLSVNRYWTLVQGEGNQIN